MRNTVMRDGSNIDIGPIIQIPVRYAGVDRVDEGTVLGEDCQAVLLETGDARDLVCGAEYICDVYIPGAKCAYFIICFIVWEDPFVIDAG